MGGYEAMESYLCVYLGSAFLALVITPVVIFLAGRINALDLPGTRNIHSRPIPRIGGVAIFTSTISLVLAALLLQNAIGTAFRNILPKVIVLLSGSAFVFVVGLIDDIRGLPARIKLLAELAAAMAVCAVGVRIVSLTIADWLTLNLGWFSWPLTMLWIVGITNAVNLSDGLDGLAAGISAIACGAIAVFAVYSGQVVMAILMLALLGSLTGFLFFNFNPAKVFMGDCGSLFLGFTISAASVMCLAKPALSGVEGSATFVGLALPVLALGIPIFDTLLSMLRRFLERRSLFSPDRSHFHHRLLDLGLAQRHVVVTIYLVTLLSAGLGLFMMVRQDIGSLIVFGCVLLLIVLLFQAVGTIGLRETLIGLQEKYVLTQRQKQERATFEHLQLQFRQVRNFDQRWLAICEAAQQMNFVWVCLKTSYEDGRINTTVWRTPSVIPPPARGQACPCEGPRFAGTQRRGNLSHIVTVTLPFGDGQTGVWQELEIAIWAGGSLEAAGHRATLFSRLIDEHNTVALPGSA